MGRRKRVPPRHLEFPKLSLLPYMAPYIPTERALGSAHSRARLNVHACMRGWRVGTILAFAGRRLSYGSKPGAGGGDPNPPEPLTFYL